MAEAGVWSWTYQGGEFEVNFVAGGEFVCPSYPAHAHWNMTSETTLFIDWGKFGKYEMKMASATEMSGSYQGHPESWRKGVFKRAHTQEESAAFAAHAHEMHHEHHHEHGGSCSHHH
jgi:hypothetical protein